MKRISKEENREDKRLMLERFKTIYMGGTGEIVEKKSRPADRDRGGGPDVY